jgi:hypothetical protein
MKIVYVNTPTQDENTENPQIINNHVPKWNVRTSPSKENQTLKEFFEDKWNYIKSSPNSEDIIGFYLYDVIPVGGFIDGDNNFIEQSALFVRFDYMKKNK